MKTWMCDKDVFNTILDTFCGTFMNTPVDRKSEEGRVISKILEAATTPVSVPARQVRLGNKKVRFVVKKSSMRFSGISVCGFPDFFLVSSCAFTTLTIRLNVSNLTPVRRRNSVGGSV